LRTKAKAEKFIHPDLHFAFPVNKTKSNDAKNPVSALFLEEWRKALLAHPWMNAYDWYEFIGLDNRQGLINAAESLSIAEKMRLKPYEGRYKIMVIWLAEKMNIAAANKLLKLLEEPEGNAVFLLVSEDVDDILPTILSRTQLVKLGAIDPEDLSRHLQDKHHLSASDATHLSRITGGNYRRCLQIMAGDGALNLDAERFKQWMRLCFSKNVAGLLKFTEDISKITRENQKTFLEYALHMVRDSMVHNAGIPQLQQSTADETDFLEKFSPYIHSANVSGFMRVFDDAILDIERNINSKMVFFDMSVQIMQLFNRKPAGVEQ
jgi:DNA polymerase-3 subunit delta'